MVNVYTRKKHTKLSYKILSAFITLTFVFTSVLPPGYAQTISTLNLPVPGAMVTPSAAFVPVLLKGMTIHPDNPLQFDFIIDSGNTDFKEDKIKTESERLVKYFLASMTIPKDDLWVNLSPYEQDRIIPDELGKTELGRDMLAQDYILKQLTASLMYPEKELGKEFWDKVYQKAKEKFGTTEIPVDTFNKVWILPETATVYEHGQTVYIVEAKLRVMLDQDYVAGNVGASLVGARAKAGTSPAPTGSNISTSIIREIILPEIEHEVNYGQNFAPLRQIYHSLILAKWYKETIKNSLLSKIYIDQKKIAGVNLDDVTLKDQIYAQYMEAYKKGVFNYIKEDYDQLSTQPIPRKYFSGGEELTKIPLNHAKLNSPVKGFLGKGFVLLITLALTSVPNTSFSQSIYVNTDRNQLQSDLKRNLSEEMRQAASKGDFSKVRVLLNSGEDVDAQDSEGVTVLMIASEAGHSEIVRFLLDRGADPNHMDDYTGTSLLAAAFGGHIQVVELLLDKGVNVNTQNHFKATALDLAAQQGYLELTKYLITKGADINHKDFNEAQPIHAAARGGHTAIVKLFLSKGVDVNAKEKNGVTVLEEAVRWGKLETTALLLNKKADVNSVSSDFTPLIQASWHGYGEIVKLLLSNGADINMRNSLGATALMFASAKGHVGVVEILLKNGAKANIVNNAGKSAMDYAKEQQNKEIIDLLKKASTDDNSSLDRNPAFNPSDQSSPSTTLGASGEQGRTTSSPIAPREAEAKIKGKLAPEHHRLVNDTHVQVAMAYEGDFDVVYHAGPPEGIEITRAKAVGQSSPSTALGASGEQGRTTSSPVFMEEMRDRAAKLGIPLGDNTKIAVFIGGNQILSDHYYQMFKEVVRGNFGFDLVYLPFVIDAGAADTEARIRMIKEELAHNPRVVGAVVTRPWKERFYEPGDHGPGAINYIVKGKNGELQRSATDGQTWLDGLNEDLKNLENLKDYSYNFENKEIVILGSGASATELAVILNGKLQGKKARITFTDTDKIKMTKLEVFLDELNRSYKTDFPASKEVSKLRRAIQKADILINATGVGRGETEGQSPLLPHLFAEAKHDLIVIDLISNTDTQMLKDARQIGPEGVRTFNGRSMYAYGMVQFIKGWMAQAREGEQVIPSDDELHQAILKSEFTPKGIFQPRWSRFGYNEDYARNMGEFINKIASLSKGKVSKTSRYDTELKAAIVFTGTRIIPDVYVVDNGEESFGAEWIDQSFDSPSTPEKGIYIEQSLLDRIKEIKGKGDPEDTADMLVRVFVHVLTTGSIVKKRKAQFEYAKAKFPRLVHHLLDPVNGGTKNIEQVLWDVRDNVLGLATAGQIKDYVGEIGVPYTIEALSEEKQHEIKRHAEELADIAESALHKIAINALNKTIDLSLYQRMHFKEHEMTSEDRISVGMLAYAAHPPTFAHALVAALKAMAESNSDIFFVSVTANDFRKPWLGLTYEKRQSISEDFFNMLSGGLIRVAPRLPHDNGLNGEEKILPILDILDGAGAVKLWYGAGDDHYFAFAVKKGIVQFNEIFKEGPKKNDDDFAYYVNMPGYRKLVEELLKYNRSLIQKEYLPAIDKILQAENPTKVLEEARTLAKEEARTLAKGEEGSGIFFPVLDTVGKLWLIQDVINRLKDSGRYSTDFTLGMSNFLREGPQEDPLREFLNFSAKTKYISGASFEIAATNLRKGVEKLIREKEKKIDLVKFEAMSKNLLKQLLSPTSESREYLYSMVRQEEGLIAAKAAQTLFPLDDQKEDARHQKLMDKLKADLSAVVPDAVVDERVEGDISKITVSDAGRMNDLMEYTYSVHNGLYVDGRGKEIVLVVNTRSREDMSLPLKKAIIKAIKSYVHAYNYADGFREVQDTLIQDLVRRDKNKSELSSADADVIMIAGNDDLNVYREALYLISRGIGKRLLISGGVGRLRDDIKKAAEDAGFENIAHPTDAGMIRNIMVQMAEKAQQPDLVEKLKDDNFVILEDKAAFTVENFNFAKQKLIDRGLLGDGQQSPLKLLYMHKPLQQLRANGNFNSAFSPELEEKKITGVSYTTAYSKKPDTPGDIVAEYFRIIANHQKKRKVMDKKSGGWKTVGDWEFKHGLKSVPESHWEYARLLFDELNPEEKRKLVDAMYVNIKDMKVDDRTVLYKNLPAAAKALAETIYGYDHQSSSPVAEQQGTGYRGQGTDTANDERRDTSDELGGIDMNSIGLERQGAGVDIRFDPAELQELIDAGIDGFAPVIINITPLPSVLPLLGLEPRKEEDAEELSKVN